VSVRSRALLRIGLGIAQLGLGAATIATWLQQGLSRAVLALAVATAAAVAVSLVLFRHER
jgi:hypothetical protein